MRLYRIPGAYVYGLFGSFGAGKTLHLVEQAIEFACYHRKPIAANFFLNEKFIRLYGKKFNYSWLKMCRIKHSLSFEELMNQENSILLLDEAGVEIFSRSWKDRKKDEIDSLFRIRHYRNKLIYAAQDWTQVDIQFRRHTHICLWIRGFQYYPQFSDPQLISRLILYFHPSKFEDFLKDPINKVKIVYPLLQTGFRYNFDVVKLNPRFKYLFACYNSFDRYKTRNEAKSKQKYYEYDPNWQDNKFKDRIDRNYDIDDLL